MFSGLSERKREILDAIVTDFVNTAEPVGSFTITRHYLKDVSPATVRNEMKELEETGYITHPHVSAGRIPTDHGYRYYVDHMMETKIVSGKELTLIKNGIKKIGRGVEEVVHGTLKMVSSLLNYAAVFVSFGKRKLVASAGLSNMLKQPEFQRIDYARHIVETVEHEELITRMLEEYSRTDDVTIKIGHENKYKDIKDLSVVVVHHNIKGIDPGAIGILGPTRMDYNRVTSILREVSDELDRAINQESLNV